MPENDRGIGSEGPEQVVPDMGNDYSRKDLGLRDAGDTLTTPNTESLGNQDDDQDSLNMDSESSRNLTENTAVMDDDLDKDDLVEDDLDDDDDDEIVDLDDDDDDDEDIELDKGL